MNIAVYILIVAISTAAFILLFKIVGCKKNSGSQRQISRSQFNAYREAEFSLRGQMDSWLSFLGLFAVLFGLVTPLAGYLLQQKSLADERSIMERVIDQKTKDVRDIADNAIRDIKKEVSIANEKADSTRAQLIEIRSLLEKVSEGKRVEAFFTLPNSNGVHIVLAQLNFSNELAKAESGNAVSQFYVASMYHLGKGVEKDDVRAADWYGKAAKQGLVEAKCNLGWMYENGYGVNQDISKTVELYKEVADKGFARGQCDLAQLYWVGKGVEQDFGKAFSLYMMAAEQGDASAQYYVGNMYSYGIGVKRDYTIAEKWWQKAAGQGDVSATFSLAYMYELGHGSVHQDLGRAEKLYFDVIRMDDSCLKQLAQDGLKRIWNKKE